MENINFNKNIQINRFDDTVKSINSENKRNFWDGISILNAINRLFSSLSVDLSSQTAVIFDNNFVEDKFDKPLFDVSFQASPPDSVNFNSDLADVNSVLEHNISNETDFEITAAKYNPLKYANKPSKRTDSEIMHYQGARNFNHISSSFLADSLPPKNWESYSLQPVLNDVSDGALLSPSFSSELQSAGQNDSQKFRSNNLFRNFSEDNFTSNFIKSLLKKLPLFAYNKDNSQAVRTEKMADYIGSRQVDIPSFQKQNPESSARFTDSASNNSESLSAHNSSIAQSNILTNQSYFRTKNSQQKIASNYNKNFRPEAYDKYSFRENGYFRSNNNNSAQTGIYFGEVKEKPSDFDGSYSLSVNKHNLKENNYPASETQTNFITDKFARFDNFSGNNYSSLGHKNISDFNSQYSLTNNKYISEGRNYDTEKIKPFENTPLKNLVSVTDSISLNFNDGEINYPLREETQPNIYKNKSNNKEFLPDYTENNYSDSLLSGVYKQKTSEENGFATEMNIREVIEKDFLKILNQYKYELAVIVESVQSRKLIRTY